MIMIRLISEACQPAVVTLVVAGSSALISAGLAVAVER